MALLIMIVGRKPLSRTVCRGGRKRHETMLLATVEEGVVRAQAWVPDGEV